MNYFLKSIKAIETNNEIDAFIANHVKYLDDIANEVNISLRFVVIQAKLHLPFYQDLQDSDFILKDLKDKIVSISRDYKRIYNDMVSQTGVLQHSKTAILKGKADDIRIIDGNCTKRLFLKTVDPKIEGLFNNHLHYIRFNRQDSIVCLGLFLEGYNIPFAIASFSYCKRAYQIDALNVYMESDISSNLILSMTRAFAFDNCPKNSMSKLFNLSCVFLKKETNAKFIVTAVNPFLGFSGGVFFGSSFYPYAYSPMEYWYDEFGYYTTRNNGKQRQKQATPPIMWLVCGLDKHARKRLEYLANHDAKIMQVSHKDYGS